MSPRKRRPAEKFRSLYLWHRYTGLVAALLVIWLAATGLLLNHSEDLDLSGRFVRQDWLLSLYNVEAPEDLRGQLIDGHWLAQGGDRVYLDAQYINEGNLVDAASAESGLVLAFSDRLALHTDDGDLIEEIPFTASTAPITAVQNSPRGLLVSTAEKQFLADAHLARFTPVAATAPILPASIQPLPPGLAKRVARDVLHHSLDWERVLLDLHAGRIAGAPGNLLADIAGVLLLLLAISGVIVWMQRRRR